MNNSLYFFKYDYDIEWRIYSKRDESIWASIDHSPLDVVGYINMNVKTFEELTQKFNKVLVQVLLYD